ncbi:alpha/beta fold hydrolase [Reinekea blandensis]|uniref:Predicted Hydrolase or acyltransferase (Alpha/beta hydrolase superfamily) protein n=1 Tax=Reinekea blandensis MED297 TaxID=314283 RepID=A4BB02_9GAMM|nr:alpha/beta hydrolase [Reinekea blandensis]EAR10615.1 predicted Hydrolase or acyltransferase (alpha/beta hydrolase superfamily) protein [Reinekea sp. MED297] [Reinekea blandensis MED297]
MRSKLTLRDGRQLAYRQKGSQGPTVIFESGMTCDSTDWVAIQDRLAEQCPNVTTLIYDRAGLGQSDFAPIPKTRATITDDLAQLLSERNLPAPYVLVGHSFGGFLIKHYSHCWPEKVAALVFVDGSDATFESRTLAYRTDTQRAYWQSLSTRPDPDETEAERQEQAAFYQSLELDAAQPLKDGLYNAILVCDHLTSWFHPDTDPYFQFTEAPESLLKRDNQTWIECHRDWLKDAPNAHFHVVENSTHAIHLDQEAVVLDEVVQAIKAVQ